MKNLVLLFSLSVLLWNCGDNKSNFESTTNEPETQATTEAVKQEEEEPAVEAKEAVCLYDNLSVRATPADKGKWVTSISLGEVVTFTGEKAIDSLSNNTFLKIQLNGGKEGWTRADFVVVDGQVGAFREDTEIYKRPDLLTKKNKKYNKMDIIAIVSEKGDWVEVKGKRSEGKYIESGWVKKGNITSSPIDVATAKFGANALAKEDPEEKLTALKEITENNDLISSVFIPYLESQITEIVTDDEEIVEEIIEQAMDTTDTAM